MFSRGCKLSHDVWSCRSDASPNVTMRHRHNYANFGPRDTALRCRLLRPAASLPFFIFPSQFLSASLSHSRRLNATRCRSTWPPPDYIFTPPYEHVYTIVNAHMFRCPINVPPWRSHRWSFGRLCVPRLCCFIFI